MVLWLDEGHDAAVNMTRDAALLERARHGATDVILRLFTFSPPGITLGHAQDPARELDLERLRTAGVTWAVRPTGGRAIWHDEEWTFSLVTPLNPEGWAPTPSLAYERTARLLADALQDLGVPARLAPGHPRGVGSPRAREGAAPPCFASTARHELVIEDRKLAGIAQRTSQGVLLQQGSLLLGPSHARLAEYLALPAEDRVRLAATMRDGAAEAGPWLGTRTALAHLADAIAMHLPGVERLTAHEGGVRFR